MSSVPPWTGHQVRDAADECLESNERRRRPICDWFHVHAVERAKTDHQYFSAGRISTAPPNRAAGIRAASSIAASMLSASYTAYPAAPSVRYVPFLTWVFPSRTCTVFAVSGNPSGSPGVTPAALLSSA